jgi:hypothetical protein
MKGYNKVGTIEGLATMDIATATPAEIDTEIARLTVKITERRKAIDHGCRTIDLETRFPAPDGSVNTRRIDQARVTIEAATLAMERLKAQVAPLDAEYSRRGGWTRYFLVDASNGHVHYDNSAYRCSRTRNTQHYWLTSESGKTAAEIIAQAGSAICTICFPDAPVDSANRPRGYHTPSELERVAKAAGRETRRLAKEAKKITNPDGSVLRYGDHEDRIETVVAAERAAVDAMFWPKVRGRGLTDADKADIERILTALAAKRGTTVEAERAALQTRYVAKCKREQVNP